MYLKDPAIPKFRQLWKHYVLQSALGGAVLLVIAVLLGEHKVVTVSAMGATSFILFAMPTSALAQTRNVLGGHIVGLITGAIFILVPLPFYAEYGLVVGLATLLMVALDVEHPPAAGTALAVLIHEISWDALITILVSALVLSQCRYYLRSYLKDLV
jgi:CBS-domain-containing membrane protein